MGLLENLDAGLGDLASQWNPFSTTLITVLIGLISYRVLTTREPDVHPMLLARQAVTSPVRNEGESRVFRSQSAPFGIPLNGGLNVKDEGASKWSRGRDGDLRDVWRKATKDSKAGGKVLTVLGAHKIEHNLEETTRQINLIGQHIADQGGIRVAIYLPNSIELLVTLFACSFYPNLTTVLLPFNVSDEELVSMLRRSAVDTLVTAPGSFPFDAVIKAYPSLRQLIWVTDEGSSHMDWNEVPEGTGSSINVATWQDIIRDAPPTAGSELPSSDSAPSDIVTFYQNKPGQLEEMVRFSQTNLVSAIAAQLAAVPAKERFNADDLFLPADSLANVHTLVLTLTALYSEASVSLSAVTDKSADLMLAAQSVAPPTIMVASPQSLLELHTELMSKVGSPVARAAHAMSTRALAQDGTMTATHILSPLATGRAMSSKLRLVYTAERAGADTPRLSAQVLSDLRVLAGIKIVYALTAPKVAGAIAQTAVYDYRLCDDGPGHFGAPLTNVEIVVRDSGNYQNTDDKAEGEIVVRGPCVAGGEVNTGVLGRFRHDYTLTYI